MNRENNKFSVVRAIPEQFIKNEYDRVKLGAFRSSINFYEERIEKLLEMKGEFYYDLSQLWRRNETH